MDILLWITENSQLILMLLSIFLAIVARYFGAKATLLATAMQSLIDLQQEFLNDIRDGVISSAELDQILAKIQAASKALQDVIDAFLQTVPLSQKIAIVFGGGDMKAEVAMIKAQVQSMKLSRMNRH